MPDILKSSLCDFFKRHHEFVDCYAVMNRKNKTVMVTNSTDINNKTNKYITRQISEHKQDNNIWRRKSRHLLEAGANMWQD